MRAVRNALVTLSLTGLLLSTAGVAQAHTPRINWKARATKYQQVAPTKTRVFVVMMATSFRDDPARMRCKVRPSVRVEDATGVNTWYQATWIVRWRVPPNRRSTHGWWLGVEHPEGTANGWRLGDMTCHA